MEDQAFKLLTDRLDALQSGQTRLTESVHESQKYIERMLERHEGKLEQHAIMLASQTQRTDDLVKRLDDGLSSVRTDMKTEVKEAKAEIEKKIEPMEGLFKNVSGAWTFLKWAGGILGGAVAIFYAYMRIMLHFAQNAGTP